MSASTGNTLRTYTLNHLGIEPQFRDELLSRNGSAFCFDPSMSLMFPRPDEPFVEVWERYAEQVRQAGSLTALCRFLVQLRFPLREGISQDPGYIAVTRRGASAELFATSFDHTWKPAGNGLVFLHATPAGRIPCIFVERRQDFEYLVRALSYRNEPGKVPDSMGACVISGYNNWDRIEAHKLDFVAANGLAAWPGELARISRDGNFRDSFLILSGGGYSGVQGSFLGMADDEWNSLSLRLRLAHEAAHYFTRRVLGSARNHVCDEVIADFFAMTQVFESFDGLTFLRFFGLERHPKYREGGRLQNYRGNPPISDGAFEGLQKVFMLVAHNLELIDREMSRDLRSEGNQAVLLLTLCQFTIEEMAALGFAARFMAAFRRAQSMCRHQPAAGNLCIERENTK